MRRGILFVTFFASLMLLLSASSAHPGLGRHPLAKPVLVPVIGQRVKGFVSDPKTGLGRYHDYDASVVVDKENGRIVYQWTEENGRRVTLTFEPATQVDVVVVGTVTRAKDQDYEYVYELDVLPTSTQRLQLFSIETGAKLISAERPDDGWNSEALAPGNYGFDNKLPGWCWVDVKYKRTGITPGSRQTGFTLESPTLPGVITCRAQGYTLGQRMQPPSEELPPAIEASIDWRLTRACLKGNTLGPFGYAEKPAIHIDQVSAEIDEMVGLGWIESSEVAATLKSRLADIRSSLDAGKAKAAAGQLDDVLALVQRLKDNGDLLSESYGILYFNCKAIRDQLHSTPGAK